MTTGVEALSHAIMRVEEVDEKLGVVGRGRMVDRIYEALTPAERLSIAGFTEERLAAALVENIPALHRWLNVGWKNTMYDDAIVPARALLASLRERRVKNDPLMPQWEERRR